MKSFSVPELEMLITIGRTLGCDLDSKVTNELILFFRRKGKRLKWTKLGIITDINPKEALTPYNKKNRGCVMIRPAVLTATEVEELLNKFSGESRRGMSILLVDHRNEPYLEINSPEATSEERVAQQPLFFRYEEIGVILKSVEIGDKHFRLVVRRRVRVRNYDRQFQLWEVGKK